MGAKASTRQRLVWQPSLAACLCVLGLASNTYAQDEAVAPAQPEPEIVTPLEGAAEGVPLQTPAADASVGVLNAENVVAPPAVDPVIEVRVRGLPRAPLEAASDYRIEVGQLANVPRRSAESLLTLAPGLLLTNVGGQFHASSIFLRGFNAGEGQDIEFSLQGIPINDPSNPHGHGYADTHFIIASLVSELRVTEGPFDPRQGDFAVAGSARYDLSLPSRGVTVKAGMGSFQRRHLTALWGPKEHGPGTFVGFELEDGNGFGTNRAFGAVRLMARHEFDVNDRTKAALLFTSYGTRFDAAGVIRRDDYLARRLPCGPGKDEQFFCTYDRNQGGASQRHGLALQLNHRGAQSLAESTFFVTMKSLRLRQNFTGFLTDVDPSGLPQRGDGVEQAYSTVSIGSRGSYRFAIDHRGVFREAELGYFGRLDRGTSAIRRLRTVGAVPYRVDADDDLEISNIAAYALLRAVPFSRLALTGGVRVDGFVFSVTDHNRPNNDRIGSRLTRETTEAYGLSVQPRVNAQLKLAPTLRLNTAVGVGSRSSNAQALSAGEFAPFARVLSTETGLVWERLVADAVMLDARMVGFYTHVTRDMLFDELEGRNVMTGASNRFGSMASARASTARWDVMTSVTYAEAYLPPPDQQGLAFTAGNRMPYIPRWVARGDASWTHPISIGDHGFELNLASGFTYVAPRPLPYAQLSPALVTLDTAARVEYKGWQLGLEVTNLLDRRNREYVFNYASNFRGPDEAPSLLPQQHFSAGSPRVFFLTLSTLLLP